MKTLFHKPWSDTPKSHITTFARQLEFRQSICKENLVIITDTDKFDHFVAQMYLSDIFESKLLDNWEDGTDKDWFSTKTFFVTQYNKEQRKINRAITRTSYDRSSVLRETPAAPSGASLTSD